MFDQRIDNFMCQCSVDLCQIGIQNFNTEIRP
jgi:hypothetical protein